MPPLLTFDALHTLLAPRAPIHIQYADVFAPFLGVLPPAAIQRAFAASLSQLQRDRPAYRGHDWWPELIKRTAIGAGADPRAVEASLNAIVPRLMDRFSSGRGYKLFDDTLPVLRQLQEMNIRTALVSNSDARMRLVLADLGISFFLHPIVLSEEQAVEKPNPEIFHRAMQQAAMPSGQAVHVGDDLHCDYHGARAAGMQALLLRRPNPDGDHENKRGDEDIRHVVVVSSLHDVVDWVRSHIAA